MSKTSVRPLFSVATGAASADYVMTHGPANKPPGSQTRANQRRQGRLRAAACAVLVIIDQKIGEVVNYTGQGNNACSAWPECTARLTQNWSKNKKW